jgi:hypothetical protein
MRQQRKSTSVVLSLFVFTALTLGGCTKEAATTSTAKSAVSVENAAFVFSENFVVQIDDNVWLPCANGGAGENVHIFGPLHVLNNGTFTDNTGRVHYQLQSEGMKGIGSVTGDEYKIIWNDEETRAGSVINGRFVVTFVESFRIIGPGPGNNYSGHVTFHFTYNANGEETASFDNFTADCK